MHPDARRAADIEAAFLAGVEASLDAARGRFLPGLWWTWTTRSQEPKVREMLADAGLYDRRLLQSMPKNTARILTGSRPRWLLGRKVSCVAVASVLSPLDHYLKGEGTPPAIDVAELAAHVRELVGTSVAPHWIGVCSPAGFTVEVRNGGVSVPGVTLVLIERRDDGGWTIAPGGPGVTKTDAGLFNPEGIEAAEQRIRAAVAARSAVLLTEGLSAGVLGTSLGLTADKAAAVFEKLADDDATLRLSRSSGEVVLYRGTGDDQESPHMSMADRIRHILSGEGDETRKINALSERRIGLTQRRERIYTDLDQLEKRERELIQQGQASGSQSAKRRIVAQVKQLRDEMNKFNTVAGQLGRQIEIISTHIHNLTLIQQGKQVELPSTEEITHDAVRAEEMLEQLGAEVELAGTLNTGTAELAMSEEELAILEELDAVPQKAQPDTDGADAKKKATQDIPAPQRPRREPQAE